jgi:hypothetical protein
LADIIGRNFRVSAAPPAVPVPPFELNSTGFFERRGRYKNFNEFLIKSHTFWRGRKLHFKI